MDPRHKLLPNPRPQRPVFCKECKWYESETYDFGGAEYCNAPINRAHTYLSPNYQRIMSPAQRNKRNRCGAFEKKITLWMFIQSLYYFIKAHLVKD